MGYSIFDETMVDMAWPQIEQAIAKGAIALLPTGVIEEHGPHMGLGVDTYCGYLACKLTRRHLEARGVTTLVAPPYYWGMNSATGSFPGSFTVRKETMVRLLYDILASLQRWGITRVFNINWHGDHDHNSAILEAVKLARVDTGVRAYCILDNVQAKRFGLTGAEDHVIVQTTTPGPPPRFVDIHAGAGETSVMASYFPSQVNQPLAATLKSTDLETRDLLVWRRGWNDARKVTPLGYLGDPAGFDAEAGQRTMEARTKALAGIIETFLRGEYEPPRLT